MIAKQLQSYNKVTLGLVRSLNDVVISIVAMTYINVSNDDADYLESMVGRDVSIDYGNILSADDFRITNFSSEPWPHLLHDDERGLIVNGRKMSVGFLEWLRIR